MRMFFRRFMKLVRRPTSDIERFFETKRHLAKVSPTFCPTAWKFKSVGFEQRTVKSCCHHPMRKVNSLAMEDLDPASDVQVREQLLRGQKAEACNFCWRMEGINSFSDRLLWSRMRWAEGAVEEVARERSPQSATPTWLELSFSPICQLKCAYCNPGVSTAWRQEVTKWGAYPTLPPTNKIEDFKAIGMIPTEKIDPKAEFDVAWSSWLKKALEGAKHITLTGGEPLLSPQTFQVLEWLVDHPNPQLELSVNSNCSLPAPLWDRFVALAKNLIEGRKILHFHLQPSLDSWGTQAEYIRYGLDLDLMTRNIEHYLEQTTGNVYFNCTLNALSFGGLKEFWNYILSLKRKFSGNRIISTSFQPLLAPDYMSINILPDSFIGYLDEAKQNLQNALKLGVPILGDEILSLDRARSILLAPRDPALLLQKEPISFVFLASTIAAGTRTFSLHFRN